MRTIAVGALSLIAPVALCQTPATEPDPVQSLLVEVHQLRQAIEAMTGGSQRVQIALYTLQMQDAIVARATQRWDSARNKCSAIEENRKHLASEVQRMESAISSGARLEGEAASFTSRLPNLKSGWKRKRRSCRPANQQRLKCQVSSETNRLN